VSESRVAIDACDFYPQQRDGRIDTVEAGMSESRWVEQQVGGPVVMCSTTSMLNTPWNTVGPQV
jgi:hypothetical protein